jgi:hypothetical protein
MRQLKAVDEAVIGLMTETNGNVGLKPSSIS